MYNTGHFTLYKVQGKIIHITTVRNTLTKWKYLNGAFLNEILPNTYIPFRILVSKDIIFEAILKLLSICILKQKLRKKNSSFLNCYWIYCSVSIDTNFLTACIKPSLFLHLSIWVSKNLLIADRSHFIVISTCTSKHWWKLS